MPNSNAIATVTIQDQDALVTIPAILAQRVAASVTFPSLNTVNYSGYQLVTLGTFINVVPAGVNCSFVYIRNANTSGNAVLILSIVAQGSAVGGQNPNLYPGGIFLYANSVIATATPFTALSTVQVAVVVGQPVTMEYMYAF
jgi:hypothetical protein